MEVTRKEISLGKRNSCMECPVALAIKRRLKVTDVIVGYSNIMFSFKGKTFIFETPENVVLFMKDFDNGKFVDPINFNLH